MQPRCKGACRLLVRAETAAPDFRQGCRGLLSARLLVIAGVVAHDLGNLGWSSGGRQQQMCQLNRFSAPTTSFAIRGT